MRELLLVAFLFVAACAVPTSPRKETKMDSMVATVFELENKIWTLRQQGSEIITVVPVSFSLNLERGLGSVTEYRIFFTYPKVTP